MQAVGKCWETCRVASDPSALPSHVRKERRTMQGATSNPAQPEHVLVYRCLVHSCRLGLGTAQHCLDSKVR